MDRDSMNYTGPENVADRAGLGFETWEVKLSFQKTE
jgi:hypothetical protein